MIHLDEKRTVIEWTGNGAAPTTDDGSRSCRDTCPYTIVSIAAVAVSALAIWSLAERPGDWLLAIARAPGFAINPDIADAVAGAEWLGPSIRGGLFVDAIGAAIVAFTLVALIALRVRQRLNASSWDTVADYPAGVYKIVTNQTNADDRRSVAWHGWTSSPVCERVRSTVCG